MMMRTKRESKALRFAPEKNRDLKYFQCPSPKRCSLRGGAELPKPTYASGALVTVPSRL